MKKRFLKLTAFSSALSAIPMIASLSEATHAIPSIVKHEPLIEERYLRLRVPSEHIINSDTGQINTAFAEGHLYSPGIYKTPIYRGYGGNYFSTLESASESFAPTIKSEDSFKLNGNWEPYDFSNQEEAIIKIYSLLKPKNLSTYNLEGIAYNPFNSSDKTAFIDKVVSGLEHNSRYADIFRKGYRLTMDGVDYANHNFMLTAWDFLKEYKEQSAEDALAIFSTSGGSREHARSYHSLKWAPTNDTIVSEFGFNSSNSNANSFYLQHNGQEIIGNSPDNFNLLTKTIGENIKKILSKYFDNAINDFKNEYKKHGADPSHHFNHVANSSVKSLSGHEKYNWAPETVTNPSLAQFMYPLDWIVGNQIRKGRLHGYWTMGNPHKIVSTASHNGLYFDFSSSGESLQNGGMWGPYYPGLSFGTSYPNHELRAPWLHGNWYGDLNWHGDWDDNQHYWQAFDIANNIEIEKSTTISTNTTNTKVSWNDLSVDQLLEIRENWFKRVMRTHIINESNELPQHDKALYIPKSENYNVITKNPADGNNDSKIISYTLHAKKWFKGVGTYPTYSQDALLEPSVKRDGYSRYVVSAGSTAYGNYNTKFKDSTKTHISYDDQVINWNGYSSDDDSFGAYFNINDMYDLRSDAGKEKVISGPFNNLNYSLTEAISRLGIENSNGLIDLGNGFHSFSEYGTNESDSTPYQKLKRDFIEKTVGLIKKKDVRVRDPRKIDTGDKGATPYESYWIGAGNSLPTPDIRLGGGDPLPIVKPTPSTSGTKAPVMDKNPTPTSGNPHTGEALPDGSVWMTVLDPTKVLSSVFYTTSNGENLWLENKKQSDGHYKYVYSNNMISSLKQLFANSATSDDIYISAWRRMTNTPDNVQGTLESFMNYLYLPDLPSTHKLQNKIVITKNINLSNGNIVDIDGLSNAPSLASVPFAHSAGTLAQWKTFSGNIELKNQIDTWIKDNLPKRKMVFVPSLKKADGLPFSKQITTSLEVATSNLLAQIGKILRFKIVDREDLSSVNARVLGSFDLIPEIDKVKVYYYQGKYYYDLQKLRDYISDTIGRNYLSMIFGS